MHYRYDKLHKSHFFNQAIIYYKSKKKGQKLMDLSEHYGDDLNYQTSCKETVLLVVRP